MINYLLQWNPKFSQFKLGDLGVLFMSESEEYLVEKDHYELLNSKVLSNGKLSDYVFHSEDVAEQIRRINQADQFNKDQILVEFDANITSQYVSPDFTEAIKNTLYFSKQFYSLSCCVDLSVAAEVFHQMDNCTNYSVVLIDDYNDPRLQSLSEILREEHQDWLLLKLSGELPIVGPYFKQNDTYCPCFNCLSHRLRQNKPVREWYKLNYADNQNISLPILKPEDRVDDLFHEIINQLKHIPEINLQNNMYEFSKNGHEYTAHYLSKRPQCSSCGDPELFKKNILAPVILQSCFKDDSVDGGYRSVSRDQTLGEINKLISPYTGVISNLRPLSSIQDENKLNIYRAAYFQNSYSNELPTADTFIQLSLGKGVFKSQAKSSALGEAIERLATQYMGDEPRTLLTPDKLEHRYYLPHELSPFSSVQYKLFDRRSKVSLQYPQWVRPYCKDIEIYWTPAWSLSHNERVYFPFAYCFSNTPFDDHVYSLYNHNGNSAGNTREEAILQGALEVIERDAVAIWWYNKIPRSEISLSIIEHELFEIIDNTLSDEWDYWLLDVSNDIDVVCCVSVGQHKLTKKFVLGFGAHLKPQVACQRALTEMYQLIQVKEEVTGPFDFNDIEPEVFLFPGRNHAIKTLDDYRIVNAEDIKYDIYYLLEVLKLHNLDLCVVDYSRPDLKLATLKVIIPGLCHMWPQFENIRLYDVPVKLGWLSKSLKESDFNSMPLYL